MLHCFTSTIKAKNLVATVSSPPSQAAVYCGDSCVWGSSLWGQEVRLGRVVSLKASSSHVCWHASLNKCPHHPSRNASLYRIRLWQTSLYSVAEAAPPPQSPMASCTVWQDEVRGCVRHRSAAQCLPSQLWFCQLCPMAAGSDATVHPMSHPPHLKTQELGLCSPYKAKHHFSEDCVAYSWIERDRKWN